MHMYVFWYGGEGESLRGVLHSPESIQIFLSMDSKADVPKVLCLQSLQSNQFV